MKSEHLAQDSIDRTTIHAPTKNYVKNDIDLVTLDVMHPKRKPPAQQRENDVDRHLDGVPDVFFLFNKQYIMHQNSTMTTMLSSHYLFAWR